MYSRLRLIPLCPNNRRRRRVLCFLQVPVSLEVCLLRFLSTVTVINQICRLHRRFSPPQNHHIRTPWSGSIQFSGTHHLGPGHLPTVSWPVLLESPHCRLRRAAVLAWLPDQVLSVARSKWRPCLCCRCAHHLRVVDYGNWCVESTFSPPIMLMLYQASPSCYGPACIS